MNPNFYGIIPADINNMITDWMRFEKNFNTVKALVSGHPRELEKVSVSGAVRLRELFP